MLVLPLVTRKKKYFNRGSNQVNIFSPVHRSLDMPEKAKPC